MRVIKSIPAIHRLIDSFKKDGKRIGLVPTMGALHEGHMSLVRKARKENDIVVVSIFVNPIQFAPGEDFKKYPRTAAGDMSLCRSEGVDIVFYPAVEDMYPGAMLAGVYVAPELTGKLCGKSRGGHFEGVCTVVSKLFNIITPDSSYFGQKDYQQFLVIKKMVKDLNFRLKVRMCPIVREKDGLAISSRNVYLSADERNQAICLYEALKAARLLVKNGEKVSIIKNRMKGIINAKPSARIDYISVCNSKSLEDISVVGDKMLIALAVYIGKTRLIDNDVIS